MLHSRRRWRRKWSYPGRSLPRAAGDSFHRWATRSSGGAAGVPLGIGSADVAVAGAAAAVAAGLVAVADADCWPSCPGVRGAGRVACGRAFLASPWHLGHSCLPDVAGGATSATAWPAASLDPDPPAPFRVHSWRAGRRRISPRSGRHIREPEPEPGPWDTCSPGWCTSSRSRS